MEQPAARRRPVLKAALGGVVAVGAVGGAARVWPGAGPGGRPDGLPALALVDQGDDGISELAVPLDGPVLARRSATTCGRATSLSSTPYSMLGLTWDDRDADPVLEVRTRTDGQWGDWLPMAPLADRPDASSGEGTAVASTELVWIGLSDGVRVRVGGVRPRGLTLVLLQPWAQPGDEASDDESDEPLARTAAARGSRAGRVPRPELHGRRQWGARESWRDGRPHLNHTIKQVHVHHTVNSNSYRRRDVPALIRGMYRYHTRHLGWSDIGYNFLVDRFGRIWTGRAGGARRPVRGAHTLGFNSTSAGVAVIGNFELARPSDRVLDAVAAVAAWKLQPYGRDPLGNVRVWSHGSDRFRAGRKVRLPAIDGHRDTNQTACPGRHLYHHLDEIRHRAAVLIERYSKVRVAEPPALHGTPGPRQHAHRRPGHLHPRRRRHLLRLAPRRPAHPARLGTSVRRAAGRRRHPHLRPHHRPQARPEARHPQALDRPDRRPAPRPCPSEGRADGGRLRVAVRVTSPRGVRPVPSGKVVVKVDGRRAVVRLTDGRGVATFGAKRPLPRGRYWVKARYLGDRSHDSRPRHDPGPHPSLTLGGSRRARAGESRGSRTWTKRSSLPRWLPWHSCASCSTRWPA